MCSKCKERNSELQWKNLEELHIAAIDRGESYQNVLLIALVFLKGVFF